ncbi:15930_t:CDS:2 [Entrophospora sp. SA101]|nr:15930_t:CDS:2 [Entrophospora sp. SA101]CAJ0830014.1 22074_t:CDS:2 [Entrophospora sp. SA101]CAJ0840777.1 17957_t:CDS:2 [Entrophospora sp. SA101]
MSTSTSTIPIPTMSNQLYQQNPTFNNNLQANQKHTTQENNYLHQQQAHQNFAPSISDNDDTISSSSDGTTKNFAISKSALKNCKKYLEKKSNHLV